MRARKLLVTFIVLLSLAYFAECIYLWSQQSRLIYSPERSVKSTPDDYHLAFEGVRIPVADEKRGAQFLDGWWIPSDATPRRSLLYLHGTGSNIGANLDASKRFHGLGFSVLLIDYRGYGRSDGDFPSESGIYEDAQSAWSYLTTERDYAPQEIFIYGHSLGGAVAVDLAHDQPEAAGLILESTFTSMAALANRNPWFRFLPLDLILDQRFDSLSKIPYVQVPILLIHGKADRTVPFEMSRTLFEEARSPKELLLIPGGSHNNSGKVGRTLYTRAVEAFATNVQRNGITDSMEHLSGEVGANTTDCRHDF